MPSGNYKTFPAYMWIPPDDYPIHKITITRTNGVVDDVTDYIQMAEFTDGVTDMIGDFEIRLINGDEGYTGRWEKNNDVKLYLDYGTSAETLRFTGKIERVYYTRSTAGVKGRSVSINFLAIRVTKSYSAIECSVILKALIAAYGSGFTSNNVNTSSTTLTVNWYQVPFWDCVRQLCEASGFDCYVDCNKDFHFFESGSIENNTECVVHGSNLLNTGEFGEDYSEVKNKVTVYGATINNIPLIYTATDSTLFNTLGRWQEEIISDSNITTMQGCQDRANNELAVLKVAPVVGEVMSIGLPTISPGEKIKISDPLNGINPTSYKITQFTHKFAIFDMMRTTLSVEKQGRNIATLMKGRIEAEQKLSDTPNPYEMAYSYNDNFDTDTGTHDSTSISESRLLSAGGSGTWISDTYTSPVDVTSFQLKIDGEFLTGAAYFISVDNGMSYQSVTKDANTTSSGAGNKIKIKIVISSANTQIDSIALLYK